MSAISTDPRTEMRTRATRGGDRSPVMTLLILVATIGVLGYSVFLLNPANRGDFLPYTLVIVAESILVFHAMMSMWTVLSGSSDPATFAVNAARKDLYALTTDDKPTNWAMVLNDKAVTVDVFITAYGEPVDTVMATARAAMQMKGRHRTWVLDDGDNDELRDRVAMLGAHYLRRHGSAGAKAGNINNALSVAKGDYFLILDADFVPQKDMLERIMPFFVDDDVAFVQTPQSYGNESQSAIATGAAYLQTMFYRYVQPGRNRFNAAFCVGTNVVFRRDAIDEIGGIYTGSKSEDVWTSLLLHERGWRSIFLPEVLAVGDAPESVEAYSKQQLRWATGGFEILFTHPLFSRKSNLSVDQRLQYFVTATFYLTGIAPMLLLVVPALEIYFDLRPMDMSISAGQWLLFYAGFYGMQILLMWFTLGTFRWQTLTLATVSFPIYTKALLNVLTGKDEGWSVTGAVKSRSPYNFMVPQILIFVFLALTSVVSVWRDTMNGVATLATIWNVINTVVLASFMAAAAREERALRAARRVERRARRAMAREQRLLARAERLHERETRTLAQVSHGSPLLTAAVIDEVRVSLEPQAEARGTGEPAMATGAPLADSAPADAPRTGAPYPASSLVTDECGIASVLLDDALPRVSLHVPRSARRRAPYEPLATVPSRTVMPLRHPGEDEPAPAGAEHVRGRATDAFASARLHLEETAR
ncbi:glycosyltransferase family 2 protein [Demequina sp. NBRC 110054]|uniref:glycosyltransferase family 2 protein n=1 Tax=Demequina sp. NBRC 110054 TaxID=1570343 RepID=UPI00117889E1|nr:glycosyltransferase [Demequina sp. NBRC 110054]